MKTLKDIINGLRKKFECPDGCNNFNSKKFTIDDIEDYVAQQLTELVNDIPCEEMGSRHPENYKHKRDFLNKYDNGYNQHVKEIKDFKNNFLSN